MSNKVKGVKIRYANGTVSDEYPIGALAQNVDYDQQTDIKQKIDAIDFTDRIKKGSGAYSLAEGHLTTASGKASHSQGSSTIASHSNSHAEGHLTTASGLNSHAEGSSTTASGPESHAEGSSTTASDSCSHAEGGFTVASGVYSHVEGKNTVANHRSQHVFGEYNKQDTNRNSSSQIGNYIEIVGNGTSDQDRSNARTLDWNGNEWLAGRLTVQGNEQIGGNLVVNGTIRIVNNSTTKTVATVDQIPDSNSIQTLVDTAIENSDSVESKISQEVAKIKPTDLALDAELNDQDKAAPAATVGTKLNEKIDKPKGINQGQVPISDGQGGVTWGEVSQDLSGYVQTSVLNEYVQKPKNNNEPTNGNNGQILKTNGNGTTEWINQPDLSGYVQTNDLSSYVQTSALNNYIQKPKNNNQPTNGTSGQILKTNGNGTTEWINQPDLSGYVQIPTEDRRSGSVLISNENNTAIIWSDNLVDVQNNLIRIPKDENDGPTYGTAGQVLSSTGDEDAPTAWVDPVNLKTLYNLKNRKFLFIGDQYCLGFSNTANDCNPGWAYYCAQKLGLKRTQTLNGKQISDKYMLPVQKWTNRTNNQYTTETENIDNQTINDDYEIICNKYAKFSASNTGTTFEDLLVDAYERKYSGQNFTDIVICGGYNDRNNTGTEIANGIRSFVRKVKGYTQNNSQIPGLYPNARIYIGHIAYNKKGNGNNAPENKSTPQSCVDIRKKLINVTFPAYKASNLSDGTIYLYNVEHVLQNENLSNDDGYSIRDSGSKQLGNAIASALLNNSAPFPYHALDARIKLKRKILFIGTDFLLGYTYNGVTASGCYEHCEKKMPIFRSLGSSNLPVKKDDNITLSRIDEREDDSYKVSGWNRAKFHVCIFNDSAHNQDNYITFENLLIDAYERKYVGQSFTDIIIIGGWNEYDGYSAPVDNLVPGNNSLSDNGKDVKAAIENAVKSFCEKAAKLYPQATVYVACTGARCKQKMRSKENQQITSTQSPVLQAFETLIVCPAYSTCESYGAKYIDCTDCYNSNNIIDPVDPNTATTENTYSYSYKINNAGLQAISTRIVNTMAF